jgi:hypothetical protein
MVIMTGDVLCTCFKHNCGECHWSTGCSFHWYDFNPLSCVWDNFNSLCMLVLVLSSSYVAIH